MFKYMMKAINFYAVLHKEIILQVLLKEIVTDHPFANNRAWK